MLKRSIDITFSVLLLLPTMPVLACLALIIMLDSEGPVLFRQVRMGRRFRSFRLYKLRTMDLGGDGPAYTLGADPRITRSGRWLRHLKLDELPQLWNVLIGDMSLVGPRPVIPELALEFRSAYVDLLQVRPGLTDPASLRYCNETEILAAVLEPLHYFKTVVTPDKIRISRRYLKTANSLSDLGVAIGTFLALVSPALRRRVVQSMPGKASGYARIIPSSGSMRTGIFPPKFKLVSISETLQVPAALIDLTRAPRTSVKPISV